VQIIVFSKHFREKNVTELIALAQEHDFEGYDLCVRPGYAINPQNAATELPKAVERFRNAGLDVPMITANFDVLSPDHPTARPILAAMDRADVRLIKLGYFSFDHAKQDYWDEVDRIRQLFAGWEELGREYHVKICYHTHSHRCMGLNCGMLAHLIRGFDPQYIGAYIDPGHMNIEGEEFVVGAAIVRQYLSIVALKDTLLVRKERGGHGAKTGHVVTAGNGMVDWTALFAELARIGFGGPLSVHCEFEVPESEFSAALHREVAFFKALRDSVTHL